MSQIIEELKSTEDFLVEIALATNSSKIRYSYSYFVFKARIKIEKLENAILQHLCNEGYPEDYLDQWVEELQPVNEPPE